MEAAEICYGAGAIPSTGIVLLAVGMKQGEKFPILHCPHMEKRAIYPYKALSSLKIAGTGKQKKALLPAFVHR